MTAARAMPVAGGAVEIDVPGVGAVARAVAHVRDHGDGHYGLTLLNEEGQPEFVTIAPSPGGWSCIKPPVNLRHAVFVAECLRDGVTLHGSATAPERLVARALLEVLGLDKPAGPACRLRMDEAAHRSPFIPKG